MAVHNLTNLFNNQDKRYAESVVMTIPAQLDEGGQRLATPPTYIANGDALTAAVVEPDTIIKGVYLIVDEAFPAGTTLDVDIAGTQYFVAADVASKGIQVSSVENIYLTNGQTITVGVNATGTVAAGVARVVLDTVSPSIKNGNYAAS